MQIDWFTVGAQVVNFLILVLLLKKFLYQPVINAMERREQSLLERKRQIETEGEMAQEKMQLYQNKIAELDEQEDKLLAQAKQDAETEKEKLLQQLRMEVADDGLRWREEVDREKRIFLNESRQLMGREIVGLSRKVLVDLANIDLQQQVVSVFLEKLVNLSVDEKAKLESALSDQVSSTLVVISSFDLSSEEKKKIVESINSYVPTKIKLKVEVDPELICGLVLRMPGGEFEWNIKSFLSELDNKLAKALSVPVASR